MRLHARRARVSVPEGVDELVVELPAGHEEPEREIASAGGTGARFEGRAAILPAPGPGELELALAREDAVEVRVLASPRPRAWPLVRRLLTEGRDRAQPFVPRRVSR